MLVLPAKKYTKAEIRNSWSSHTQRGSGSPSEQWEPPVRIRKAGTLCIRCSKVQLMLDESANFLFSYNSTNKTLKFQVSRKGITEEEETCIVSMASHLLSRSSKPLSALSHLPFQAEKLGSGIFFKEYQHYKGSRTCKRPKPCTQDSYPLSPY